MVTDHWIFRSSVFYLLTSYNMINQHIYIRVPIIKLDHITRHPTLKHVAQIRGIE